MCKWLVALTLGISLVYASDNLDILNEMLSIEQGQTVDVRDTASNISEEAVTPTDQSVPDATSQSAPVTETRETTTVAPPVSPEAKAVEAAMIPFGMHETLPIDLSSDDPNRIFVSSDKIINVSCPHGFCLIDQEHLADTGDLLLSLTRTAQKAPAFTFFVSTESGAEFTVLGRGRHIMGQTIGFIAKGNNHHKILDFEKSAPYPEMVIALMKNLIQFDQNQSIALPDGYHLNRIDQATEAITTPQGFTITPVAVLSGGVISGVIYRLNNHQTETLNLSHKSFYQHNMVAVALSKESLQQGEIGFVYALFQGGRDAE